MTGDHSHARTTPPTRAQWEAALAAGTLTAHDAVERMRRVATLEFGTLGAAGYDRDGFITALIAEGVRAEGGVTLRIHTRDHPPPHVHIERPGEPDIRLDLQTGEVIGELPRNVTTRRLRGLRGVVRENHALLATLWTKNHGDPIRGSRPGPHE